MANVKINYENGYSKANKVEVDGTDLARIVGGANISLRPGDLNVVSLDIILSNCEINTEANIEINTVPVSDEIGQQIYEQLKELYGE